MNAHWDTQAWYRQEDIRHAVNLCMKAIEESGISAERAALIPECLAQAIDCGNDMILSGTTFKSYDISAQPDGRGGVKVFPTSLPQTRLRQM